MEVRQLRYAVLLAESRHFGRAASRAFVTQSALSQQISKLERELGIQLFRRDRTPIEPTPAGEEFLEHAAAILTKIGALERDMSRISRRRTHVLRVGVFGAGLGELTPVLLDGFRRATPDVRLELAELTMTTQLSALEEGVVDVALLHLPFDAPGIEFVPLFEEPRYAALPYHHPLAEAPTVSLADLADEQFVAARHDVPERWRAYWGCAEMFGDPDRSAGFEMGSVTEGLNAVAYLDRVDTAPASGTRYYRHPGVRFVRLTDAKPATAAVARKRGNDDRAVLAFLQFARRLARDHASSLPEAWPVGAAP